MQTISNECSSSDCVSASGDALATYGRDVSQALASAVISMRNMAASSTNFKKNIFFLKQQAFKIGHSGTTEYKACMRMLKIAFPKHRHKTLLNHIYQIRKILNSKSSTTKTSLSLTSTSPSAKNKDTREEQLIIISDEEEEEEKEKVT